jgi:hypothetical protein
MALDHSGCLGDNECLTLCLDQGPPLSQPSEDAYVSFSLSVVNTVHKLPSYPVAYAITILPTTIARWLQFNHKKVSSATILLCVCVFDLSGATNVLLFLIIRPQLLLFTPPEDYRGPEAEIGRSNNEISNDTENYNHSLRATEKEFADYGELDPPLVGNGVTATVSRIESGSNI